MLRIAKLPLRLADRLVERVMAVAGALTLSQFPGFVQHYVQRLGGHLAEAERNLEGWRSVAVEAKVDGLQSLVDTYLASDRLEVLEAGRKCADDICRVDELRAALGAVESATPWQRPIEFLRHLDLDIARATAADFTPNVPLDAESLVYAVTGVVLAALFYFATKRGCQAGLVQVKRRRARRRADATAAPGSAG